MNVNGATEQQKLFVEEFLKLRKSNQTQAAINAGYSKKSAMSQASQLLKNPKVRAYLEEREKQLESELRQEFFFDALEARKVMYGIMKNDDARDVDRLNAAKDFLDRAGFKPTDNIQLQGEVNVNNPFKGLTTDELKKLIDNE